MGNTVEWDALSRVVAVINGKGGVGKTTLTANLGGLFAKMGLHVLVVDMDESGNLGIDLGYYGEEHYDDGLELARALRGEVVPRPSVNVRPSLDVLPGGSELAAARQELSKEKVKGLDSRLALARALTPIAGRYDVILIDCPPGDEPLQNAAVAAARWLLVPIRGDAGSKMGLAGVAGRLSKVATTGSYARLLGVTLFATDPRAVVVRATAEDMVKEAIGVEGLVFDTAIRHSSAVAQQTRSSGLLVHELEEQGKKDFRAWLEGKRKNTPVRNPYLSRTARPVAAEMQDLAEEVMARIIAREHDEIEAQERELRATNREYDQDSAGGERE